MALKIQCFLPDGTAHTQGLWELSHLPAKALHAPQDTRDAREEH